MIMERTLLSLCSFRSWPFVSRAWLIISVGLTIFAESTLGTVYFKEEFDTPDWESRWVQSEFAGKEWGKFEWTAGKFYGDDLKDKGIKTSQDARFYGLSTKFEENKFDNEGKDLVIQFSGMRSNACSL